MATPRSAYLGSDLPDDQLRMPPARGSGAMLGNADRTPEQLGADVTGGPEPNPIGTSAGGGENEALEIIYNRARQYLGLGPEEVLGPVRGTVNPAVLDQLAEGYPDDGQLLDAIDFIRQQSSEQPPPPPDTTNIADAGAMRFRPDRPY